jgi:hypothetical protein
MMYFTDSLERTERLNQIMFPASCESLDIEKTISVMCSTPIARIKKK